MRNEMVIRGSRIAVFAAVMFVSAPLFATQIIQIAPSAGGDGGAMVGPVNDNGNSNIVLTSNIEWANVGTTWATGSNWVGGVAPADSTVTDIAQFGSQGSSAVNPNLTAQRSVNGVTFLSGAFAYTVGGSTLIIGSSGIVDSATNAETFSNGLRTSASQTWTSNAGASLVFNGTVDINQSAATSRTLTLSGAGNMTFNNTIQNSASGSTGVLVYNGSGVVTLAHANTYTGGTTISGSGGQLAVALGATLGSGNVSLTAGNVTLTLQGATNIASSATLSYVNTDTINLQYGGTMTVAGLIVDGVAQPHGIYGQGFNDPDNAFFGEGSITVVPEPATWGMMLLGGGLLTAVRRFRRKQI